MGFSIGRLLGGIASTIGGILTGQPTAILGGITTGLSAFNGGSQQGPPQVRRALPALIQPAFDVKRRRVATDVPGFEAVGRRVAGSRVPGAIAGLLGPGVGVVAAILDQARQSSGLAVTARKIRDSARNCGIELTAQLFGISELDVCTIVIQKRSRRGRGITAAALRTTRSTIRKVETIHKSLHTTAARARRPRSKH